MSPGAPHLGEEERRHLTAVVDRLSRQYGRMFPPETIRGLVEESLALFSDARITSHLPLLVERVTKRRLEAELSSRKPATA